ncbi:MAG: hypothetical protein Q8O00_04875, partial [Holophaga sp.]|nr:hypothetical protein [Holophaga sp.]
MVEVKSEAGLASTGAEDAASGASTASTSVFGVGSGVAIDEDAMGVANENQKFPEGSTPFKR